MLSWILLGVFAIIGIAFLIWFIARTPINLRSWYGVPVVILVIVAIIVMLCLIF